MNGNMSGLNSSSRRDYGGREAVQIQCLLFRPPECSSRRDYGGREAGLVRLCL